MKFKTQRKINNIQLKLNNWIMEILCYPINILESKIKLNKRMKKKISHPNIYNWLEK